MRLLTRLFEPKTVAYAHCDLPCGVYDPAQARIEAESVKAIEEKYQQNTDPEFRTRCLIIKEQRSELVKHHLWVLWTDYFKPPHFEKYPQLNQLFNEATKLAGAAGTKGSSNPATGGRAAGQDRRDQQDLLGDQAGLSEGCGHETRVSPCSGVVKPGFHCVCGAGRAALRGGAAYFSARAGGGRLLAGGRRPDDPPEGET